MYQLRHISILILLLIGFQTAQAAWVKQKSETLAWLRDVAFINENKGFIVGSNGTFLETTDGGRTWVKRQNFTDDTILQIYFADESTGWLLCERDIYNRGRLASSYLLKTADGGRNWERTEFTNGGRERLTKIFFNSKGDGFAVGENGTVFSYQNESQTWERQILQTRYKLLDGIFRDDKNASIVGAGGSFLFSEDGGASWNQTTVVTGNADGKFNAVFFINPKNGWLVGANGRIFQTFTGGKTWREQNSGVTSELNDVTFLNSAEGFAVGNDGTILHTKTAGNVWDMQKTGLKHRLEKVFFIGKKGFAVGFGGSILKFEENVPEKSSNEPKLIR